MSLERETLVRLDSENPRYLCCGKKVEVLALRIAIIEILFSLVALVVVLSVAAAKAPVALPSVSVTVVLYVMIKVTVSCCILYGVLRNKHSFLIAYLVFKGLEIGMAAIGILIGFLAMVGFTALYGLMVTIMDSHSQGTTVSPMQFPPDDSFGEAGIAEYDATDVHVTGMPGVDADYHSVIGQDSADIGTVEITGVLAGCCALLGVVIGTGVYFFIAILKTYHMLQDRDYHEYNLGLKTAATNEVVRSPHHNHFHTQIRDQLSAIRQSAVGLTRGAHDRPSQQALYHQNSSGDLSNDVEPLTHEPEPKDPDNPYGQLPWPDANVLNVGRYFTLQGPRFERL